MSGAQRPFPVTYAEARASFRAAADRAGWVREIHPVGGQGPEGETLAIDVARWLPPTGADRLLVISSGLHGVEGPFGSAVQVGALADWAETPPGVAVLLLHALNPFGFAWSRRVDADNVDPNRNFLLPGQSYQGSAPIYARLDPLLNPTSPPAGRDGFVWRMALAALRHRPAAMKQALVTGQYDFPKGLFFGGAEPSALVRLLDARFPSWAGGARIVVHLDLHTGLGPFGTHKLLVEPTLPDDDLSRMIDWFGRSTVEQDDPRGTSYRARGTFGAWCRHRTAPTRYLYGCAEFGTHRPLTMLAGLRAENRAYHWGGPDDDATATARAALRELFCPADPAWRARVSLDARGLVDRALVGLESA